MESKRLAELLGLTGHEARLYLAGLQFDAASLTDLSKVAGVPRTAAYYPLKQLGEKGLMSTVRVGKRLHYRSISTEQLQLLLDERKRKLSELSAALSPSISIPSGNFSVQYFPGLRGIETAGDIFLHVSKAKRWYTFEHPLHSLKKHGEGRFDDYIKRRVERKIHTLTIVPGDSAEDAWLRKHLDEDAKELRETLIVSAEHYPIDASLATDGEWVLMFTAQGVPFATLIHNTHIARSFVSLHTIAWERYKN